MEIVSREELGLYPTGTVFASYTPSMCYGDLRIIINKDSEHSWNKELSIMPSIEYDNCKHKDGSWDIYDINPYDEENGYDEDEQFIVFSKEDVNKIINILKYVINLKDDELL